MADYTFYYWSVPFRGQFIRAILAFAGKSWDEKGDSEIGGLLGQPAEKQPIGFMGPPVLVDTETGFALAQMPAIAFYLGEKTGLLPASTEGKALAIKVFNDANDVIDEITLDGGRDMWTAQSWRDFVPRLSRWMGIFEDMGRRRGLAADKGFLLGGENPGAADVVTSILWHTLASRFPAIGTLLDETAPAVAGLVARMMAEPSLQRLQAETDRRWPDAYCGGQIEASLKTVLNG